MKIRIDQEGSATTPLKESQNHILEDLTTETLKKLLKELSLKIESNTVFDPYPSIVYEDGVGLLVQHGNNRKNQLLLVKTKREIWDNIPKKGSINSITFPFGPRPFEDNYFERNCAIWSVKKQEFYVFLSEDDIIPSRLTPEVLKEVIENRLADISRLELYLSDPRFSDDDRLEVKRRLDLP